MDREKVVALFEQFSKQYDFDKYQAIWADQSRIFKDFWANKIVKTNAEVLIPGDTDLIIRLLDIKARGHQKTDEAVAKVGICQGLWERLFKNLREKKNIRELLSEIFQTADDEYLITLINKLESQNEKNGLTGKGANMLNTLLFINNPNKFTSCITLGHRSQIMKAFNLGNLDNYKSYGEKIIRSNSDILNGFKEKYGIDTAPRALSVFFYSPHGKYTPSVKNLWRVESLTSAESRDEVEDNQTEAPATDTEFAMEKHLEDFLVRNWESTDLGKQYEFIVQDGENKSPQYITDVGRIDLLVLDKKTRQYTVIELKKGPASDTTIGQLTRYMGWVKKNLSAGKGVKGVVITSTNDEVGCQ